MSDVRPAEALLPDTDASPLDPPSLASYLDRIGVTGPVRPDLATLHRIVTGHTTSIPFEALDAYTGRTPDLTAGGLTAKLVRGSRGGWCFEHNGLLRRALDAVGFRTTGLAARVRWGEADTAPPTVRTHMALLVDLPEGTHVADAGFGGMVATGPLRLEHGTEQKTPLEPYRLLRGPAEVPGIDGAVTWTTQALVGDAWRTLYTFELSAAAQIDYEMSNFYLVAHPRSLFRANLIAARPGADRRTNLSNRTLAVHHLGGPSEQTDLDSPSAVRDALEERLGIDTSGVDGLDARLAGLF
ncbi:arylamine N-acetyltransferase family protein [Pseudonocardia endophytica]|uniref:Arylamine N-acetyltransferase/N-hydroxyarylamine O-acetyltransferase n=1 Tax=Pseudonocardia endophytica TaxID=401976 RepID=A0A4R1HTX3_PSEEN|nr:arylamine N-acetyltransferase [Pseudonocardia endophytica]TCK24365.1 arylamine N-acetyltransferase/N-hydroxyarylamine O-acetyltransferase [Pseudonocardia endophytica]